MADKLDAATIDRVLTHMNQDHKASLLAYAWNILNYKAAKKAKLVSVDSKGFEIIIDNDDTPRRIQFDNGNSVEAAKIRGSFVDLHKKAMKPFIPPGPPYLLPYLAPFLAFFGLFILLPIVAYPSIEQLVLPKEAGFIVQIFRGYGVKLVGSVTNLTYIFYCGVGVHVVEFLVAVPTLRSLKLGTSMSFV
mmetsp:Transcript_17440/g.20999  ORF Transcript_17440/g.20999 Transcript_17440/m.20999 type:complete len:190 (+) Transcript_17440:93-662(+)